MTFRGTIAGTDIGSAHTEQRHQLGLRNDVNWGTGSQDKNSELFYIEATAALELGAVYFLPTITETDAFKVGSKITKAVVDANTAAVNNGVALCVPVVAIPAGQWGWAFVKGHVIYQAQGTITLGNVLLCDTNAGKLNSGGGSTNPVLLGTRATIGTTGDACELFASSDLWATRQS